MDVMHYEDNPRQFLADMKNIMNHLRERGQ
jgi:hypothetical protein